ncbi:hypothetical protein HU200_020593 [Digitaria exilis]|uniref:UspA domain-containing protein n=1 Tax=Digitaria exilis TaxID=1010633 RepID=A0A835F2A4_9POAL|nr:hypothetical protein HU200_020593 [Digitaria exilis]
MAAGRNIGVAVDFSPCSKNALRWAAANLASPGDRLILIQVKASYQYEQGVAHLWERDGSPLIPMLELSDPRVSKIYGLAVDRETLEILTRAAGQRGVQVFAKVLWGDPARKLTEAVHKLPLHWLVVGNRGLGTVKRYLFSSFMLIDLADRLIDDHCTDLELMVVGVRVLMGSVSTYVVNHAACPVTVVRENMLPSAQPASY